MDEIMKLLHELSQGISGNTREDKIDINISVSPSMYDWFLQERKF